MTTVACMLWSGRHPERVKPRYGAKHVRVLHAMLRRTLSVPFRMVCVTDRPLSLDAAPGVSAVPLPRVASMLPGVLPKLWLFSREAGDAIGEPFLYLDLDVVVLDDLAHLLTADAFRVWGFANGEPYNTSAFLLAPGARTEVWERFPGAGVGLTRVRAAYTAKGRPWCDDQSYVAHVLGDGQPTWGPEAGLRNFRPREHGSAPPDGARAVFFCGPRCPATADATWIAGHWHE